MAENPKLAHGLEEKLQKISVSDHLNGFHYAADKSDSFVIDMETFSNGNDKDTTTTNSRTMAKLQRSQSRKGSQRGSITNTNERDSGPSPRGSCTPEKASGVTLGTIDSSSNPQQVHHQITITAGNISTVTDGRSVLRRNSFKRSSSWALDPKKILFIFATLSSVGTILLIYLTLSMSKYNSDDNGLDLQQ
ncbi:uncharacterized protein LOC133794321 [Humulus lupulus]|uniref:uncharacterized protein LOC133794321 n=1 Tax=Humulus lupulus TaxID=3486 RepID=UPI002B414B43|nr:uncharacterized protein LOC133794321 [Humulus lupulus]